MVVASNYMLEMKDRPINWIVVIFVSWAFISGASTSNSRYIFIEEYSPIQTEIIDTEPDAKLLQFSFRERVFKVAFKLSKINTLKEFDLWLGRNQRERQYASSVDANKTEAAFGTFRNGYFEGIIDIGNTTWLQIQPAHCYILQNESKIDYSSIGYLPSNLKICTTKSTADCGLRSGATLRNPQDQGWNPTKISYIALKHLQPNDPANLSVLPICRKIEKASISIPSSSKCKSFERCYNAGSSVKTSVDNKSENYVPSVGHYSSTSSTFVWDPRPCADAHIRLPRQQPIKALLNCNPCPQCQMTTTECPTIYPSAVPIAATLGSPTYKPPFPLPTKLGPPLPYPLRPQFPEEVTFAPELNIQPPPVEPQMQAQSCYINYPPYPRPAPLMMPVHMAPPVQMALPPQIIQPQIIHQMPQPQIIQVTQPPYRCKVCVCTNTAAPCVTYMPMPGNSRQFDQCLRPSLVIPSPQRNCCRKCDFMPLCPCQPKPISYPTPACYIPPTTSARRMLCDNLRFEQRAPASGGDCQGYGGYGDGKSDSNLCPRQSQCDSKCQGYGGYGDGKSDSNIFPRQSQYNDYGSKFQSPCTNECNSKCQSQCSNECGNQWQAPQIPAQPFPQFTHYPRFLPFPLHQPYAPSTRLRFAGATSKRVAKQRKPKVQQILGDDEEESSDETGTKAAIAKLKHALLNTQQDSINSQIIAAFPQLFASNPQLVAFNPQIPVADTHMAQPVTENTPVPPNNQQLFVANSQLLAQLANAKPQIVALNPRTHQIIAAIPQNPPVYAAIQQNSNSQLGAPNMHGLATANQQMIAAVTPQVTNASPQLVIATPQATTVTAAKAAQTNPSELINAYISKLALNIPSPSPPAPASQQSKIARQPKRSVSNVHSLQRANHHFVVHPNSSHHVSLPNRRRSYNILSDTVNLDSKIKMYPIREQFIVPTSSQLLGRGQVVSAIVPQVRYGVSDLQPALDSFPPQLSSEMPGLDSRRHRNNGARSRMAGVPRTKLRPAAPPPTRGDANLRYSWLLPSHYPTSNLLSFNPSQLLPPAPTRIVSSGRAHIRHHSSLPVPQFDLSTNRPMLKPPMPTRYILIGQTPILDSGFTVFPRFFDSEQLSQESWMDSGWPNRLLHGRRAATNDGSQTTTNKVYRYPSISAVDDQSTFYLSAIRPFFHHQIISDSAVTSHFPSTIVHFADLLHTVGLPLNIRKSNNQRLLLPSDESRRFDNKSYNARFLLAHQMRFPANQTSPKNNTTPNAAIAWVPKDFSKSDNILDCTILESTNLLQSCGTPPFYKTVCANLKMSPTNSSVAHQHEMGSSGEIRHRNRAISDATSSLGTEPKPNMVELLDTQINSQILPNSPIQFNQTIGFKPIVNQIISLINFKPESTTAEPVFTVTSPTIKAETSTIVSTIVIASTSYFPSKSIKSEMVPLVSHKITSEIVEPESNLNFNLPITAQSNNPSQDTNMLAAKIYAYLATAKLPPLSDEDTTASVLTANSKEAGDQISAQENEQLQQPLRQQTVEAKAEPGPRKYKQCCCCCQKCNTQCPYYQSPFRYSQKQNPSCFVNCPFPNPFPPRPSCQNSFDSNPSACHQDHRNYDITPPRFHGNYNICPTNPRCHPDHTTCQLHTKCHMGYDSCQRRPPLKCHVHSTYPSHSSPTTIYTTLTTRPRSTTIYNTFPTLPRTTTIYPTFPTLPRTTTIYTTFPTRPWFSTGYRTFPTQPQATTIYTTFPTRPWFSTGYMTFPTVPRTTTIYTTFPTPPWVSTGYPTFPTWPRTTIIHTTYTTFPTWPKTSTGQTTRLTWPMTSMGSTTYTTTEETEKETYSTLPTTTPDITIFPTTITDSTTISTLSTYTSGVTVFPTVQTTTPGITTTEQLTTPGTTIFPTVRTTILGTTIFPTVRTTILDTTIFPTVRTTILGTTIFPTVRTTILGTTIFPTVRTTILGTTIFPTVRTTILDTTVFPTERTITPDITTFPTVRTTILGTTVFPTEPTTTPDITTFPTVRTTTPGITTFPTVRTTTPGFTTFPTVRTTTLGPTTITTKLKTTPGYTIFITSTKLTPGHTIFTIPTLPRSTPGFTTLPTHPRPTPVLTTFPTRPRSTSPLITFPTQHRTTPSFTTFPTWPSTSHTTTSTLPSTSTIYTTVPPYPYTCTPCQTRPRFITCCTFYPTEPRYLTRCTFYPFERRHQIPRFKADLHGGCHRTASFAMMHRACTAPC